TFFRLHDVIELRTDPVERSEKGELQSLLLAIGIDDTVQELLATRVDPALLVNRPENQVRSFFIKSDIGAHTVYFRCRGKEYALLVAHTLANDFEVGFEVQLENAQRVQHVRCRCRDGNKWNHDVAFLDMVFNPLTVDRDVSLDEVK